MQINVLRILCKKRILKKSKCATTLNKTQWFHSCVIVSDYSLFRFKINNYIISNRKQINE